MNTKEPPENYLWGEKDRSNAGIEKNMPHALSMMENGEFSK